MNRAGLHPKRVRRGLLFWSLLGRRRRREVLAVHRGRMRAQIEDRAEWPAEIGEALQDALGLLALRQARPAALVAGFGPAEADGQKLDPLERCAFVSEHRRHRLPVAPVRGE